MIAAAIARMRGACWLISGAGVAAMAAAQEDLPGGSTEIVQQSAAVERSGETGDRAAGDVPGKPVDADRFRSESICGWQVHIDRRLDQAMPEETREALRILEIQLRQISECIPTGPLEDLRQVSLWMSPEYDGFPPRAEYHPDAGWLREHGRDETMARGIEFTNIRIFRREWQRMPNFALHELAHAYHDRVLGYDEPRVIACYERAKAAGSYRDVERRDADGVVTRATAYAMTDPCEYFAECTEAYFARNDFFPFTRDELEAYDPTITRLLATLWKTK
jgi:dipeptidyl-peptidase-4